MRPFPGPGPGEAGALPPYDAVILAGGRAERLGGTDKPGALVGGVPLVERVAAAVCDARAVVVVGPPRRLPGVIFTREDPPGGGPVPALRAGLAEVRSPLVVLLAADLPFVAAAHVAALVTAVTASGAPAAPPPMPPIMPGEPEGAAREPGEDTTAAVASGRGVGSAAGAVLVDDEGREQWLTGAWHTVALRAALGAYRGRSLRGLMSPLEPVPVRLPVPPGENPPWFDCDTIDDLRRARGRARRRG